MCMSGCWHREQQLFGVCAQVGTLQAFRSLCMCVYIYARFWSGSSERIIWLHRQALLQFSLAGVRVVGFASAYRWVSIDVWGWSLWSQGFDLRRLFERAVPCQQRYTPPAVQHLKLCTQSSLILRICVSLSPSRIHTQIVVMRPHLFYVALRGPKQTHTYSHAYSNFLPCQILSPCLLCDCPALVLLPPQSLLSSLPQAPSPQHLTFNPLIHLMQRVGFRHCP